MATNKYVTIQQHEPLRTPGGWNAEEKKLIMQLEEIFDDIYRRFNRISLKDLSPEVRSMIKAMSGDFTELWTKIEQTAAQIEQKANKQDVDQLTDLVREFETIVRQTAEQIELLATKEELDETGAVIESLQAEIAETAEKIELLVTREEFDEYGNRLTDAETAIGQTAEQIELLATKEEVNEFGAVVRQNEAAIRENAEQIALKVSESDVFSALDLATGQQMTISFASAAAIEMERKTLVARVHVWKNGEDITKQIPESAFTWTKDSGQESDSEWNPDGAEAELTQADIGKSCIISCTLDATNSYGKFEIINGELMWTGVDAFRLENGALFGDGDTYMLKDGSIYHKTAPGKMTVTTTAFDHSVLENSGLIINADGIHLFTGGSVTVDSGNFTIDKDGNVTIKGTVTAGDGEIGGWKISPGSLSSGEKGKHVQLSTADETYFVWAGAEESTSAPFRIGNDGSIYVTKMFVTNENGVAQSTPVDLRRNYWKVDKAYGRSVQAMSVENDTLTITLNDGTAVNFKKSPPISVVTLDQNWQNGTLTITAAENVTLGGETTLQVNGYPTNLEWSGNVATFNVTGGQYTIVHGMQVDATDIYEKGHDSGYGSGYNNGFAGGKDTYEPKRVIPTATSGNAVIVRVDGNHGPLLQYVSVPADGVFQNGQTEGANSLAIVPSGEVSMKFGETVSVIASTIDGAGNAITKTVALTAPADRYGVGYNAGFESGKTSYNPTYIRRTGYDTQNKTVAVEAGNSNQPLFSNNSIDASEIFTAGKNEGYTEGYAAGYDVGHDEGMETGYSDGFDQGEHSVTLSEGGWVGSQNTVTASNGKSEIVELPTFSVSGGDTFTDNKTTVYFSTPSVSGPLRSKEVDASSVYEAGYSAGYEAAKKAVTVEGDISTLRNTAPNYFYAQGTADAYVDGVKVATDTFSKSVTINVGQ